MSRVLAAAAPAAHTVARVGAGLLFAQHGAQKLLGWFGGPHGSAGETVPLTSQMGLAGVLELGGGILIALGIGTRPVATALTGEMLTAYFKVHHPQGGFPIENNGELALLYALTFLRLAVGQSGPAEADRRIDLRLTR